MQIRQRKAECVNSMFEAFQNEDMLAFGEAFKAAMKVREEVKNNNIISKVQEVKKIMNKKLPNDKFIKQVMEAIR